MSFSPFIHQNRKAAREAAREGRMGEAKSYRDLANRITIESAIFSHLCQTAIDLGWVVSLRDGEEWTVKKSGNLGELRMAAFTADDDTLLFRDETNKIRGRVWLVYGNSGWDVIADHSVNDDDAEWTAFMDGAMAYADTKAA